MTLLQLTLIVAVNMMGSGIVMLPTNLAKIGSIALLSWIGTVVGSLAIAYGFAQAGVIDARPGGMALYAEQTHGTSAYFLVTYLYYISLAIANVAIGVSAVGYFSTLIPVLKATPLSSCISVIVLIWLTTCANFFGARITGRIGSVSVWGVTLPVALLSVIGWFWFSTERFGAAWNPDQRSVSDAIASSTSITLWAFLGMESACQNSSSVENPKRNVPLACLFGTIGAAVVYVLSTTVIAGIVPNAELRTSTGPFALCYAQMINATVGSIVMLMSVVGCVGSLLGWQFTLSQTSKAAAEKRLFPALFASTNRHGAPVRGMLLVGVAQSALALSTISPSLAEQFAQLVNLAVVTNVVPYIMSLTSLRLMTLRAHAPSGTQRRNDVVMSLAVLYSIYAVYAAGRDAVLGGTIVMMIGYFIFAFVVRPND